jgi:hypothetical protein
MANRSQLSSHVEISSTLFVDFLKDQVGYFFITRQNNCEKTTNKNKTHMGVATSIATSRSLQSEDDFQINDELLGEEEITFKVSLLGTMSSGKSTFMKWVEQLANQCQDSIDYSKSTITFNIIHCVYKICDYVSMNGNIDQFKNPALVKQFLQSKNQELDMKAYETLFAICKDPVIQDVVKENPPQLQLPDGFLYLLNKSDSFKHFKEVKNTIINYYNEDKSEEEHTTIVPDFSPNLMDHLHASWRSVGLREQVFNLESLGGKSILISEPGGGRSEREKGIWQRSIEKAQLVLFFVDLTDYYKLCFEDNKTSRMFESMRVFSEYLNQYATSNVQFVLVFTKGALFGDSLQTRPMSNYFSDYVGGSDYRKARDFVVNKYMNLVDSRYKDKVQIKYVDLLEQHSVEELVKFAITTLASQNDPHVNTTAN